MIDNTPIIYHSIAVAKFTAKYHGVLFQENES